MANEIAEMERKPYSVNIRGITNYLAQHNDGVLGAYAGRIGRDSICKRPMEAQNALGEIDAVMDVVGGLSRRYGISFPRPLKSALEKFSKKDPSFLTTFVEEAPRQLKLKL